MYSDCLICVMCVKCVISVLYVMNVMWRINAIETINVLKTLFQGTAQNTQNFLLMEMIAPGNFSNNDKSGLLSENKKSVFFVTTTLWKRKRFQLCPKSIQLSMEPMTEKSPPLWETPDDSFSDRRPKNQHWMTTSSHLSDVCDARRRSWQETEKINLGRYVMRENKGVSFYCW